MPPHRRTAARIFVVLALALAGCGEDASSPPGDSASPPPSASAGANSSPPDLAAIACATDDPSDVGELTGAWQGDDSGIYYVRHVGNCLWWFGTELRDIEPGEVGQPGFANVAAGRVDGEQIVLEWADVPVGYILNGGGLTLVYDVQDDQLVITERRGDGIPFGATTFTRIAPDASPGASPSQSPTP